MNIAPEQHAAELPHALAHLRTVSNRSGMGRHYQTCVIARV